MRSSSALRLATSTRQSVSSRQQTRRLATRTVTAFCQPCALSGRLTSLPCCTTSWSLVLRLSLTARASAGLRFIRQHGTAHLVCCACCWTVDILDDCGRSPLYWALRYNKVECARALLDTGAQLSLVKVLEDRNVTIPQWTRDFASVAVLCVLRCDSRILLGSSNGNDVLRMVARCVWARTLASCCCCSKTGRGLECECCFDACTHKVSFDVMFDRSVSGAAAVFFSAIFTMIYISFIFFKKAGLRRSCGCCTTSWRLSPFYGARQFG